MIGTALFAFASIVSAAAIGSNNQDLRKEINHINVEMETLAFQTMSALKRSTKNFDEKYNNLIELKKEVYNTTLTRANDILEKIHLEKIDIPVLRKLKMEAAINIQKEYTHVKFPGIINDSLRVALGLEGGLKQSFELSQARDKAKLSQAELQVECEKVRSLCIKINGISRYMRSFYETIDTLQKLSDLAISSLEPVVDAKGENIDTYTKEEIDKLHIMLNFVKLTSDLVRKEIIDSNGVLSKDFTKYISEAKQIIEKNIENNEGYIKTSISKADSSSLGVDCFQITEEAIELIEKEEYDSAINKLQIAADMNYPEALYRLGVRYENGEGVERDIEKAFELYTKAAEGGHEKGQFRLGLCHYYGKVADANRYSTLKWLKASAEQGYSDAIEFLYKNLDCDEYNEQYYSIMDGVPYIKKKEDYLTVEVVTDPNIRELSDKEWIENAEDYALDAVYYRMAKDCAERVNGGYSLYCMCRNESDKYKEKLLAKIPKKELELCKRLEKAGVDSGLRPNDFIPSTMWIYQFSDLKSRLESNYDNDIKKLCDSLNGRHMSQYIPNAIRKRYSSIFGNEDYVEYSIVFHQHNDSCIFIDFDLIEPPSNYEEIQEEEKAIHQDDMKISTETDNYEKIENMPSNRSFESRLIVQYDGNEVKEESIMESFYEYWQNEFERNRDEIGSVNLYYNIKKSVVYFVADDNTVGEFDV